MTKLHGLTKDMTGKRFGRLVVLSAAGTQLNNGHSAAMRWLCRCDCGKEKTVAGGLLRRGQTQSCGCLQRERSRGHQLQKNPDTARAYFARREFDDGGEGEF